MITKTVWNMLKYMHQFFLFSINLNDVHVLNMYWSRSHKCAHNSWFAPNNGQNQLHSSYVSLFILSSKSRFFLNLIFIFQNCRRKSHYIKWPTEINAPRKIIITVFVFDWLKKIFFPNMKDGLLKTCFLSHIFIYLFYLFYKRSCALTVSSAETGATNPFLEIVQSLFKCCPTPTVMLWSSRMCAPGVSSGIWITWPVNLPTKSTVLIVSNMLKDIFQIKND